MLLFFYRLFCGYLYVRVIAEKPEKILNICAAKGITIWRVSLKNNKLYFKIGIRSFKRLRLFKRNISGKIHITKKIGLPFFAAKNRKRYGMAVGVFLFIAIIQFMSGFVWNICISGNTLLKSEDIVNTLEEIGIFEGARISDIDPSIKRNELLLKQEGISWAAINIEGTKVTIDVVETKAMPQKDDAPSNLKAKNEGIIKKIEVISGTTKIKVGDAVEKGQLLVAGVNEYSDMTADMVRARGKIYAEVVHNVTVSQPLTVTEYLKTGEKRNLSAIKIFGVELPLFFGKVEGSYEVSEYKKDVSSGESYLPIEKIDRTFYKTEKTTYNLTEKEALRRANIKAEQLIKDAVEKGKITYKKQKVSVEKGTLTLQIEIKCIKDIVLEEKIQLHTRNYREYVLK